MNDILKPYLKGLSDSIRSKINNNNQLIDPQDFKSHINSLPVLPKEWYGKDVIYIDVEGNVLYSYTKEEYLALSSAPYIPYGSVKFSDKTILYRDGWNIEHSVIRRLLSSSYDKKYNYPIIVCEQFKTSGYDGYIDLDLQYPNLLSPTFCAYLTSGYVYGVYDESRKSWIRSVSGYGTINVSISCIGKHNNLDGVKYSLVDVSNDKVAYNHTRVWLSMPDPNTCVVFKLESKVLYYNINNTGWVEGNSFTHDNVTYTASFPEGDYTNLSVRGESISTSDTLYNDAPAKVCTLCGYECYIQDGSIYIPALNIENAYSVYLNREYRVEDVDTLVPYLTFSRLNDDVACVEGVWCFNSNTDNTLRLYARKVGDAYTPIGLYDSVYINDCFYADGAKFLKPYTQIGSSEDEVVIYGVTLQVIDSEYVRDIQFTGTFFGEHETFSQYIMHPWWRFHVKGSSIEGYYLNVESADGQVFHKSPDTDTFGDFSFDTGEIIKVYEGSGSSSVTISWGDGSSDKVSGERLVRLSHTYPSVGKYTISLHVGDGYIQLGDRTYGADGNLYIIPCISDNNLINVGDPYISTPSDTAVSNPYSSSVTGVVWGGRVFKLMEGAFIGCCNLEHAILAHSSNPQVSDTQYFESFLFKGCSSLRKFSLSSFSHNVSSSMGKSCFEGCSSLRFFSYPISNEENLTTLFVHEMQFRGCSSLLSLSFVVPYSGDYAFDGCSSIKRCINIGSTSMCKGCTSLKDAMLGGSALKALDGAISLERLFISEIHNYDETNTPVVKDCPNIREFYIEALYNGTSFNNFFDQDYKDSLCFTARNPDARKLFTQLSRCKWVGYEDLSNGAYLYSDVQGVPITWYDSLSDAITRTNPIPSGSSTSRDGRFYYIAQIAFTVLSSLTGASSDIPSEMSTNTTYTFTITPDSGYSLPVLIDVTGAEYTWDFSTGSLTISNVFWDVSINIVAESVVPMYPLLQDLEISKLRFDTRMDSASVISTLSTIPIGTTLVSFSSGLSLQRAQVQGVNGLVLSNGGDTNVLVFSEDTIPLSSYGYSDIAPGWLYADRLDVEQLGALHSGGFTGFIDSKGSYPLNKDTISTVSTEGDGWNGIIVGRNKVEPTPLTVNSEVSTLRFGIDLNDSEILSILQGFTYTDTGKGYEMCDFLGLLPTGNTPVLAVRFASGAGYGYALAQSTSMFYWVSATIDLGSGPVPKGWQNITGSDLVLGTPFTLTALPDNASLWNGVLLGTKPVSVSFTKFNVGDTINGYKFDASYSLDSLLQSLEYVTVEEGSDVASVEFMYAADSGGSSIPLISAYKISVGAEPLLMLGVESGAEAPTWVYSNMSYSDDMMGINVVKGWQNVNEDGSVPMIGGVSYTVASLNLEELWNGVFVGNL